MRFDIPGYGALDIRHMVCDYNGTLARDGILRDGVKEALNRLAEHMEIHVITADTHSSAQAQLKNARCTMTIIGNEDQCADKRDFIRSLGAENTVAIGNGRNDELMLKQAALGIGLIQEEGAFTQTIMASDIVCTSILDAFGLFENHDRLTATLRNK